MKILLLGSTGRTGKLVLAALVKKDIEVNCLVRNSERLKPQKGLTIFEGDASDSHELIRAIDGCGYVISVLNISRKSDFPWSALRTPQNYLSEMMRRLIPIAEEKGIQQIIICSAWGVAETKKDLPKWFRWFIEHSNISYAYRDHERQEELLTASKLNWTIVRPTGLTNSQKEQHIKETFGTEPRPFATISRQSVASYMVDCLNNTALIGKKVVISGE